MLTGNGQDMYICTGSEGKPEILLNSGIVSAGFCVCMDLVYLALAFQCLLFQLAVQPVFALWSRPTCIVHCLILVPSCRTTSRQLIVQLAALRTALELDCFLTCALNTATYITHRMVADMLSMKPAICEALFASKRRLNYHLFARRI